MFDESLCEEGFAASRTAVTTPWNDGGTTRERAERYSTWFHCPSIARKDRSIERIFADETIDALIVADERPMVYHRSDISHPLFFHPSMATQRISAMKQGGVDRLLHVAGIQPGETVVDATMGLATESLVLAYGVGPSGRVVAVESSWLLARLVAHALQSTSAPMHGDSNHREKYSWVKRFAQVLEIRCAHHLDVLRAMPDNSASVVYFDPMFKRPLQNDSASIEALRPFARLSRLSDEAWAQAMRVAERAVILKERPLSGEFERFHAVPDKPRARFAYGVWRKE